MVIGVIVRIFGRRIEKRNRDIKNIGNNLQSARSDPIGAFLVFLDLLECHAKFLAKAFLRHT